MAAITIHPAVVAACYRFRCDACGFEVDAWDEGYPYIIDDEGKRHFFFHPCERDTIDPIVAKSRWAKGLTGADLELEMRKHVGSMRDVLCFDCLKMFRRDSDVETGPCPKCKSDDTHPALAVGSLKCPRCKAGTFPETPECGPIS